MSNHKINILHLYPDLLNLYGDRGNIECLRKRLIWRGIDAEVRVCTAAEDKCDLADTDIVFVGGGSDREQEIVCSRLLEKKTELREYVENGGTLAAVCGGYQLLGGYYKTADKEIEGLGILNIRTDSIPDAPRLIGNVVLECAGMRSHVVGFENHGGRTDIGDHTPLGRVIRGYGNNGESGFEGVVYKNVIGTYLHGPVLPKNPELCDRLLLGALKHKYPDFDTLQPLDDSLEIKANEYMVNRI